MRRRRIGFFRIPCEPATGQVWSYGYPFWRGETRFCASRQSLWGDIGWYCYHHASGRVIQMGGFATLEQLLREAPQCTEHAEPHEEFFNQLTQINVIRPEDKAVWAFVRLTQRFS